MIPELECDMCGDEVDRLDELTYYECCAAMLCYDCVIRHELKWGKPQETE